MRSGDGIEAVFPVASLNFLTEALVESFETHVFPGLAKGQPLTLTGNPAPGYSTNEFFSSIGRNGFSQ